MRINIHAFLWLFSVIVFFICLTGTGWFGATQSAWISVILATLGWGLLIAVAKVVNKELIKVQKKLNKKGFYILDYSIPVTQTESGGTPGINDAGYFIHLQNRACYFSGGANHNIGDAIVKEIFGDADRKRKYLLVFYKTDAPDVYVSTRKNASLA